jgi:hypothetical protein
VPKEGRSDGALKLVLPGDRSYLYHIEPGNQWFEIVARNNVNAPDAEELASLVRKLKPYVHEVPTRKGLPERFGAFELSQSVVRLSFLFGAQAHLHHLHLLGLLELDCRPRR